MSSHPTAAILIIGNEILSGQTQDINVLYLTQHLAQLGIDTTEVRMVLDCKAAIIHAINDLKKYTYVFTTGGIGPTHDDITSESIAEAFGVSTYSNPEALRRLQERYPHSKTPDSLKRMSYIPVGSSLIDNPKTAAPGFQIENVYVMAGIPAIMQSMFETLIPRLQGGAVKHEIKLTCPVAEGVIANDLRSIQDQHPDIEIGSYPRVVSHGYNVLIVAKGRDMQALKTVEDKLLTMFKNHNLNADSV